VGLDRKGEVLAMGGDSNAEMQGALFGEEAAANGRDHWWRDSEKFEWGSFLRRGWPTTGTGSLANEDREATAGSDFSVTACRELGAPTKKVGDPVIELKLELQLQLPPLHFNLPPLPSIRSSQLPQSQI
jgi:hypothetical protein